MATDPAARAHRALRALRTHAAKDERVRQRHEQQIAALHAERERLIRAAVDAGLNPTEIGDALQLTRQHAWRLVRSVRPKRRPK